MCIRNNFKKRDLRNEIVEKTKGMEKTQREEIYKQYIIWKTFRDRGSGLMQNKKNW